MKINFRLALGITILAVFVLGSLILPFFSQVNPSAQGTYMKNMPFSMEHPLGTNTLGQDIMWFLIFAIRNSLLLGVSVSLLINIIAVLMGLTAGYLGGWWERAIMLITDSFITIPTLPILIILSSLIKGSASFVSRLAGPGMRARCARWRCRCASENLLIWPIFPGCPPWKSF
jgi:peptide/nickel transport system permease protein